MHCTNGAIAAVDGDPRLLRRLLRNLVENAQRHGRGSPVEVALQASPDGVRVEVRDRGPGVPVAECERVFEPFYRAPGASEKDGGVGLGLSLVRQIAQLHGGQVSCAPRPGGGSCFALWLPAASPEGRPRPSAAGGHATGSGARRHSLRHAQPSPPVDAAGQ